ncbi:hypothetical protein [Nocardioides mangrovi]|uniref:Uncharacterized protein n=1 Tax=Nocardioides mangrovi TaxID=2874580 RepID=A0ABS7UIF3_9ACTN|nr:hypothetical protein [Nocardioides mangrovi]MBZ5740776.1 hypothetical protein [Nocardioides mangrovi]
MAQMPDHNEGGKGHRVRPRWTWGALLVMLAGAAIAGWGAWAMSWAWSIAGVLVLIGGTAAAWYGGLLYDIHSSAGARAELHDLVSGQSHLGPDPHARVDQRNAKEIARREAQQLRRRQAATAASKPRLFGRRHRGAR